MILINLPHESLNVIEGEFTVKNINSYADDHKFTNNNNTVAVKVKGLRIVKHQRDCKVNKYIITE